LTRRAATSRGEIAWDVLGDGPPVVLVHGTPSRSLLWRNVAPTLAERFTVYVFDLLGFGQSERHEDQEVSVRVHGEVLAELAGAWGLDAPALIGHDIGGAAVLRAHLLEGTAARRIALVDAVVLFASSPCPSTQTNETSLASSSTNAKRRSQRSLFLTGPFGVRHLSSRRHRICQPSLKHFSM